MCVIVKIVDFECISYSKYENTNRDHKQFSFVSNLIHMHLCFIVLLHMREENYEKNIMVTSAA